MRSTIILGSTKHSSLQTLQCWKYQRAIPKMQSISKGIAYDDSTVTRLYSQSAFDGNRPLVSSRDPTKRKDGRHPDEGPANVTSQSSSSINPDSETEPHDASNFAEEIDSPDYYLSSISPETKTRPARKTSVLISPEQRASVSKSIENAVRNTQEIRSLTKPRVIASVTANRVRSLLELLFSSPQHAQKIVLPTYKDRKEVAESPETDIDGASYFPELSKVMEDKQGSEEFPHHRKPDLTTSVSTGSLESVKTEAMQQGIYINTYRYGHRNVINLM
ncbi:hypothetical protein V1525DRAFT_393155 [Lipomyces kononenkoae]|uniref:Uncharacterized protein n=1 Tax=Lipomyces kononenkoae TaxID=34357 RepID=A0ACC3TBX1_LIPKO